MFCLTSVSYQARACLKATVAVVTHTLITAAATITPAVVATVVAAAFVAVIDVAVIGAEILDSLRARLRQIITLHNVSEMLFITV